MSKKGPRLRGGDHKGSDRSKHTRSPGYKPGDNWLVCDVCGCHVYSSDAMQRWDGMVTCKQDWEPRHEQDFVRARKDRLIPQGLLRPEGEDDFTTIPGISGPDPIPPPNTNFFHDFSTKKKGPFTCVRNSTTTAIDHEGNPFTIGPHIEPLIGYSWNGVAYRDVGLGEGLLLGPAPEGEELTDIEAYVGELLPLTNSLFNNFCGQITFYMTKAVADQEYTGGNRPYIYELFDTNSNNHSVQMFFINSPIRLVLRYRLNGSTEEFSITDTEVADAPAGTRFDIRYRKSDGTQGYGDNGVKYWLYINGVLHNTYTAATDYTGNQTAPHNKLDIGSEAFTPIRRSMADAVYQFVRIHPQAETDGVIESWPTWEAP